VVAVVLVAAGLPLVASPAQAADYHPSGVDGTLAAVRKESGAGFLAAKDRRRGVPSTLTLHSAVGGGVEPWLRGHAGLFGIADPTSQLSLMRRTTDSLGMQHVRYQQVIGGVPVLGAQVTGDNKVQRHLTTAADGTFTVTVPAGTYQAIGHAFG
jgi:Fungalysin/Thermolysin Propeptide Motif